MADVRGGDLDQAAILQLMQAYCDTIDSGNLEACAALFKHGAWGIEGALVEGREAVLGELGNVTLYNGRPLTRHLMSSVHITVGSDGYTATAASCLTVMQAVPPHFPLQAIFVGSYRDRFEKREGNWCFLERSIRPDLVGDMSYHRADMAGG